MLYIYIISSLDCIFQSWHVQRRKEKKKTQTESVLKIQVKDQEEEGERWAF